MKVFYPANIRFPMERANSVQIVNTCHALAEAGAEVSLVIRHFKMSEQEALAYYGLKSHPRLKIIGLPTFSPDSNHPLAVFLWNRSYQFTVVVFLFFAYLRYGIADTVLLTRDPGLARFFCRFKSLFSLKIFFEAHGVEGVQWNENHQPMVVNKNKAESYVFSNVDGVASITTPLKNLIETSFDVKGVTTVIPDACHPPASILPPVRKHVLYIGHLYKWKGVDLLVEALKNCPEWTADIIGGFHQDDDLERVKGLISSLGLESRVLCHGYLPPTELKAFVAKGGVSVLPLQNTVMGAIFTSPLKLFEAMSWGLPIVAADLPSLRDVLDQGSNALFYRPEEASDLAKVLNEVSLEKLENIRNQAAQDAYKYSWLSRARSWLSFIETSDVMYPQPISCLSVCMIVRNEEENLKINLPQIAPWTDDLVILDSGSDDSTKEVSVAHGARWFLKPFTDFAQQKNAVCEHAKNDWVLILDADERLEPAAWKYLSELFDKGLYKKYDAWCFPRRTVDLDGVFHLWVDHYPCFQDRLYNRHHCCYEGAVHEMLVVKGEKGLIPYHITHREDNFEIDPAELREKEELYQNLEIKKKEEGFKGTQESLSFVKRLLKKMKNTIFYFDAMVFRMKLYRRGLEGVFFLLRWFLVFWLPPLRRFTDKTAWDHAQRARLEQQKNNEG